ncbi:DUF3426 domain-containing protein [Undibacterium luofuense]|uniref:DUF3426 domain-containing protein n=1 Tax=Undibacterium luofuense TaxID=2828733 RepID=UPI0030ED8F8B
MALATRCPHCQTTFRVANDQLKLHAGLVRCGACHQTFNGIEHLVPPDQAARPAPATPQATTAPTTNPVTAAATTVTGAAATVSAAETENTETAALPKQASADLSEDLSVNLPETDNTGSAGLHSTASASAADSNIYTEQAQEDAMHVSAEPPQVWTNPHRIPPAGDTSADAVLSFPEPEPEPETEPASSQRIQDEADVQAFPPSAIEPVSEPASAAPKDDVLNIASASEIEFDLGDDMPSMMAEPVATERAPEQDLAMQIELETRAAIAEPQIDWSVSDAAAELPAGPEPDPEATLAALDLSLPEPEAIADTADAATEQDILLAAPETGSGEADEDKPEFVLQAERAARRGRVMTIVYSLLILMLLPLCLAQLAIVNRNSLAAHYPQTLPLLKQVCAPLHCEIQLPARIDQISIEANELQSLDADRNLFQLNVQLMNTSSAPMAWPHLELQLNDSKDKPVILKSFAPKDYLPEGTDALKGIAGHGDQQVKIYFELSTSKASGYHVAAFYP